MQFQVKEALTTLENARKALEISEVKLPNTFSQLSNWIFMGIVLISIGGLLLFNHNRRKMKY